MAAPGERLRVLYLEDDPADIELTLRHMARHAPHLEFTIVTSAGAALERLEAEPFDAILLDFLVPDRTGLEVLQEINRRGLEVPALLVTGSGDTETAIHVLKAGAFDYVVKKANYLATLPAAIEDAVARFRARPHIGGRRAIRVLYAERTPADVALTVRHLRGHAPHLLLEAAPTGDEALRRLKAGDLDLLLLDFRLPDLDGIQVLQGMRDQGISTPVIMVTGHGDEETAVQAMKLGVLDYVVKRGDYLDRLPSILENGLIRHRLAREREALVVLNGLARAVASSMDLEEIFRDVAGAACTLLKVDQCLLSLLGPDGMTLEPAAWRGIPDDVAERLAFPLGEGLPGQAARHRRPVTGRGCGPTAGGPPQREEPFTPALCIPVLRGEQVFGVVSVASTTPREFNAMELALLGSLASHAAVAIHNARLYQELKRSYEHLQRSQELLLRQEKMAALGRLASGLAHELNNPLAAVAGFAEGLLEKVKAPSLAGEPGLADFPRHLKQIADQALRCGDLVHRLLTYARQREPQPRRVDLWQIVEDTLALMAGKVRVLGGRFESVRGPGPLQVLADPNMLQQMVINLLTNALDAVEGGGTVRLTAHREDPGPGQAAVVLEVADTGVGVPPESLSRLFDPFFTTKGPERGTGLGLPICLSIVEQHGGTLEVQSPGPDRGATATVRLPPSPA